MAMRNFWIEARIDDRETVLKGGPRRKEGGLSLEVLQRNEGESTSAIRVNCYEEFGELVTIVHGPEGELLLEHRTPR